MDWRARWVRSPGTVAGTEMRQSNVNERASTVGKIVEFSMADG
jgi:hypothetical protein